MQFKVPFTTLFAELIQARICTATLSCSSILQSSMQRIFLFLNYYGTLKYPSLNTLNDIDKTMDIRLSSINMHEAPPVMGKSRMRESVLRRKKGVGNYYVSITKTVLLKMKTNVQRRVIQMKLIFSKYMETSSLGRATEIARLQAQVS